MSIIKVIDNVVGKRYQEEIKETLFGKTFDWHYNKLLTSGDSGYGNASGFTHRLSETRPEMNSQYVDYFLPLVYEISSKSNVDYKYVIRSRSFFQLPSFNENDHDFFHVDDTETPHFVFLYYVNDSDGDTVILKNKFKYGLPDDDTTTSGNPNWHNPKGLITDNSHIEILDTVSPKQGRVVVFDGAHYHAAGIPKKNERIVLNFDVFVT